MVGGGAHGKVDGIAHLITTGVGLFLTVSQVFILMWTLVGEVTTEAIIGTDTRGTMNGLITNASNTAGGAGIMIDIGKGKETGASRAITLDCNNRDRI